MGVPHAQGLEEVEHALDGRVNVGLDGGVVHVVAAGGLRGDVRVEHRPQPASFSKPGGDSDRPKLKPKILVQKNGTLAKCLAQNEP